MNLLDENILESQRQLLRSWRVKVRQIGIEVGRKGMLDEEIPSLLRKLKTPTLFTRDLGFAEPHYRHDAYGVVVLAVGKSEAAHYVRAVLRHPAARASRQRMGKIIRANATGMTIVSAKGPELFVPWR